VNVNVLDVDSGYVVDGTTAENVNVAELDEAAHEPAAVLSVPAVTADPATAVIVGADADAKALTTAETT